MVLLMTIQCVPAAWSWWEGLLSPHTPAVYEPKHKIVPTKWGIIWPPWKQNIWLNIWNILKEIFSVVLKCIITWLQWEIILYKPFIIWYDDIWLLLCHHFTLCACLFMSWIRIILLSIIMVKLIVPLEGCLFPVVLLLNRCQVWEYQHHKHWRKY